MRWDQGGLVSCATKHPLVPIKHRRYSFKICWTLVIVCQFKYFVTTVVCVILVWSRCCFSCNMIQPDKIRILDQPAGANVLTKLNSRYGVGHFGPLVLTKWKYKIPIYIRFWLKNKHTQKQSNSKWKLNYKFQVQIWENSWCCCYTRRASEPWLETPELRTFPALTQTGHPAKQTSGALWLLLTPSRNRNNRNGKWWGAGTLEDLLHTNTWVYLCDLSQK